MAGCPPVQHVSMKFLLPLLCVSSLSAAQPVAPVNENASPEACRLLPYLYEIRGTHILAGQHSYNERPNQFFERLHELTGKLPVVWGTEFIWRGTSDSDQEVIDEAIRKHCEGHLVTLMWHAGRPTDEPPFRWRESIQGELTDEEWEELTTPGTPLHTRWLARIDIVAGYPARLRDAGVPVLWRPYHEMNSVWFWWGDKPGEDGYVKLWRMMYDRYVHHHGLNNLLWVWNANAPRDIPKDQAYDYAPFYPGHDYVDILATDVYHFDYEQKDYGQLLDLAAGRVIALGEVGQLPKPEILEAQPQWSWFMVWSGWIDTHNTEQRVRDIYGDPRTLTHEEVDLFD